MAENERTIVPGTWSDVFAGLDTQGLGRLRVQIVDENGNPIVELPVVNEAAGAQAEVDVHQLLVDIHREICKQTLILGEMSRMEVSDGDIDS